MSEHPDPEGNWFVGLPATVDAGLLDAVLAGAPPFLRRFHPADLHVTLAFFGRLAPERVAAVRDRLATLEAGAVDVGGAALVLLPGPRRPTAVALAFGPGAEVLAAVIASQRPGLLAAAGCLPDERRPLPHLTVARPPRRMDGRGDRALRAWAAAVVVPSPLPVRLGPPRLFGRSLDRAVRRFQALD